MTSCTGKSLDELAVPCERRCMPGPPGRGSEKAGSGEHPPTLETKLLQVAWDLLTLWQTCCKL